MPEFNALLGLHSLHQLEAAASRRNEVVAIYQEELGRLPGIDFQDVRPGNRNSYKDFSITVAPDEFGLTRDELALALTAENIDTRKYYEPPVHRQTAYQHFYDGRALPETDRLSAQSLSLPIWSSMSDEVALGICRAILRIHEHHGAVSDALALKQMT
jgi:dTDP-4-amino-4,6-dideoxygalactose transaminase